MRAARGEVDGLVVPRSRPVEAPDAVDRPWRGEKAERGIEAEDQPRRIARSDAGERRRQQRRGIGGMRLGNGVDWREVGVLVTRSYRLTAPKRIAALLSEA